MGKPEKKKSGKKSGSSKGSAKAPTVKKAAKATKAKKAIGPKKSSKAKASVEKLSKALTKVEKVKAVAKAKAAKAAKAPTKAAKAVEMVAEKAPAKAAEKAPAKAAEKAPAKAAEKAPPAKAVEKAPPAPDAAPAKPRRVPLTKAVPKSAQPVMQFRLGGIMREIVHAAYRYSPEPFCVTGILKGTTAAQKLAKRGLVTLDGFDQPRSAGGRYVVMPAAVKDDIRAGRIVLPGIALDTPCKSEQDLPAQMKAAGGV